MSGASPTALAPALRCTPEPAGATAAYATAIAWGPDSFDYAQMESLLRGAPRGTDEEPSGFRAALEAGLAAECDWLRLAGSAS